MDSAKQLPVFSYGTLMPGQPNYYVWAFYVQEAEAAVFNGGRIHHLGHFPMLSEGGAGQVHGFLVYLRPSVYEECLADLDYLENYRPDDLENSLYQRVEREVMLERGRTAAAWVYVGNPVVSARYPVISSGDWRHVDFNQYE